MYINIKMVIRIHHLLMLSLILYELGFTGSGNTFELTGEENLVSTLKTKDEWIC